MTDEKCRIISAKFTFKDDLIPRQSDVFIVNTREPRVIGKEYPFKKGKAKVIISITDKVIEIKEPNGSVYWVPKNSAQDPIIVIVAPVLDNLIYVNVVAKTQPNTNTYAKFFSRLEPSKCEEVRETVNQLR